MSFGSGDLDLDIVHNMRQQWHLPPINSKREKYFFLSYECCISARNLSHQVFLALEITIKVIMSHATPYAISWPVGVSIFVYVMIQYLSIQPIFLQIVYSICRCIGSVFVNSTDISTNIETAVLSR